MNDDLKDAMQYAMQQANQVGGLGGGASTAGQMSNAATEQQYKMQAAADRLGAIKNALSAQQAGNIWATSGNSTVPNGQAPVWSQGIYDAVEEFDPNNEPAYQMDLVALKDLFRAKNGSRWVQSPNGVDDAFWARGIKRMDAADMLERVDYSWYRLREDK